MKEMIDDGYGPRANLPRRSIEVAGVTQHMILLPPGEFRMGSPEDEPERYESEGQHTVILTRGLWLADTVCTQALWSAVMGESPSRFKGPELPVEMVSWDDVVGRFLPALNRLIPGLNARLPTEAEWEYACRAGTETPFAFGNTINSEQVNYDGRYPYAGEEKGECWIFRQKTVEVKALPANHWGLYQMHGNVWEWCQDWYGDYPDGAAIDPAGPAAGGGRIVRGGAWYGYAWGCRSAQRLHWEPDHRFDFVGFRLARDPS